MLVKDFIGMCDDMEQLASLIDRAMVIHEDIAEKFVNPLHSADEKQDFKAVLTCTAANSHATSIKCDIQFGLLSEAWTLAHGFVHMLELARREQYKQEAASKPAEGPNPAKETD